MEHWLKCHSFRVVVSQFALIFSFILVCNKWSLSIRSQFSKQLTSSLIVIVKILTLCWMQYQWCEKVMWYSLSFAFSGTPSIISGFYLSFLLTSNFQILCFFCLDFCLVSPLFCKQHLQLLFFQSLHFFYWLSDWSAGLRFLQFHKYF